MKDLAPWLRFGAAVMMASATAAAGAQPPLIDTQRSVTARYRQHAAAWIEQAVTGVAPTALPVRAALARPDSLVVGVPPWAPGCNQTLIHGAGVSQVPMPASLNTSMDDARHEWPAVGSQPLRNALPGQVLQTLAFLFDRRDLFIEFRDHLDPSGDPHPFAGQAGAIGGQIGYEAGRDGAPPGTLLASVLEGSAVGSIGEAVRICPRLDRVIDGLDLGPLPLLATFERQPAMSAMLLLAGPLGAGGHLDLGVAHDPSGAGPLTLVPEPATALLMALGAALMAGRCRAHPGVAVCAA